ncbi:Peroxiredoxin-2 [Trichuris trichiura]|uniref:thioredoxin-dependent peroxiredoxin n=1 Tax=Trichuris trichiura TaxID=36087 RepID=A0A077ZNK7_TRITR|nr:Peroxiredoxin-2 [Trichuris trichiura]
MASQVAEIGKPAPDFEATAVVNNAFRQVALKEYKGRYVCLFFYPRDFTFVCPTEIISFSDREQEFVRLGCQVLACSTDSEFAHLAWIKTPRNAGGLGQMKIPILADPSHKIAQSYGVLNKELGLCYRGLFIIDDKGILRQITINDLPVGRNVDEVLRLLEAFRFTDSHGEVCPANWKPGGETMKPSPQDSLAYFAKHG